MDVAAGGGEAKSIKKFIQVKEGLN